MFMENTGKGVTMQGIGIAVLTLSVTALIVYFGLSGKKIWFLDGPRSAVITLGVIGMAFCTISVGKFITAAPVHPLSILGYLIGTVALLTLLTQIFKWNLSVVQEPVPALWVLAACIVLKTVIGRLYFLVR
jgi:hypothetical protein